ncbi:MAG: sensor histidine kinase [Cyanobacteria bacterium P01_F01_bin.150]
MHNAVPVAAISRKIIRWVEWIILIQCIIDNVIDLNADFRLQQAILAVLFIIIVAAMSLQLPTQAPLHRRRTYVIVQMALIIIAAFAGIASASLFEIFIIKACLLLPMVEMIAAIATTITIQMARFVWVLPTEIETVRARGVEFYLNPQTILLGSLTNVITVSVFVVMLGLSFAAEQRNRHRAEVLTQEVEELATQLERSRIARDMHDSLGHSLTTLDVQLALARRYSEADGDRPKLQQALETSQQLTVQCLSDVRQAFHTMRKTNFDLETALHRLIEQFQSSFRTKLMVDLPSLSPQLSYQLYLIAKEGLVNVQKHAKATNVQLSIISGDRSIGLEIVDNGRGFDSTGRLSGYGLQGIKERSQLLGGEFHIKSSLGKGTTLQITVPLIRLSDHNSGYDTDHSSISLPTAIEETSV